jgi:hypothetical protein
VFRYLTTSSYARYRSINRTKAYGRAIGAQGLFRNPHDLTCDYYSDLSVRVFVCCDAGTVVKSPYLRLLTRTHHWRHHTPASAVSPENATCIPIT